MSERRTDRQENDLVAQYGLNLGTRYFEGQRDRNIRGYRVLVPNLDVSDTKYREFVKSLY